MEWQQILVPLSPEHSQMAPTLHILPRDGTWRGGSVVPDSPEPLFLMLNHAGAPALCSGADGGGWVVWRTHR